MSGQSSGAWNVFETIGSEDDEISMANTWMNFEKKQTQEADLIDPLEELFALYVTCETETSNN